jgi:hypothetical protein
MTAYHLSLNSLRSLGLVWWPCIHNQVDVVVAGVVFILAVRGWAKQSFHNIAQMNLLLGSGLSLILRESFLSIFWQVLVKKLADGICFFVFGRKIVRTQITHINLLKILWIHFLSKIVAGYVISVSEKSRSSQSRRVFLKGLIFGVVEVLIVN